MSAVVGPRRQVLVIENSTIDAMVANEAFRHQFPHLASMVKPKPPTGCGRCRQRQRATLVEYREFKRTLVAMPPQDKLRFKQFMDCAQVRVVHLNPENRLVDQSF